MDGLWSILRLFFAILLLVTQGSLGQRVKVEPEVVSYPGAAVTLRCRFPDPGQTQLTQVSWILEKSPEARTNIAVFHPTYGTSYPTSPVSGRVSFVIDPVNLDNPSIQITDVELTDEGKYICEYATYPSGNEKGVTSLVVLAKPVNKASVVTVPAGASPVVVASCESANGRPPATISWVTGLDGNATTPVRTDNSDNTVTMRSDYMLVPTPALDGKDISCVVSHRTQSQPETYNMKLVIEYPPQVQIVGYDNNWYIGRTSVVLTCQAEGNPKPTTVTWKTLSGPMPESVDVNENKLTVLKVDETVNATFICEVMNRLGTGKDQVTALVREVPLPMKGAATGAIIGGILALIIILAIIATAVYFFHKKRMNKDGPPAHKPPPPMKFSKSSDTHMHTTIHEDPQSDVPLTYYETQKAEPVTDLDSYHGEDEDKTFDYSAPNSWEESEIQPAYYDHRDVDHEVHGDGELLSPSDLSRGDSFMSAAVMV